MSFNNRTWVSFVSSLKVFPTLYWKNIFESEWNLNFAKSYVGSIKITFFPFATISFIANKVKVNFPDPSDAPINTLSSFSTIEW